MRFKSANTEAQMQLRRLLGLARGLTPEQAQARIEELKNVAIDDLGDCFRKAADYLDWTDEENQITEL
jgi:hypothetical protein